MRMKQKQHQERLTLQGNPADRQSAFASVGRDRASTNTHTDTHMAVFLCKQSETLKAKVYITCACKDSKGRFII